VRALSSRQLRPHTAKAGAFLKDNFKEILTALMTLFTAISSYLLVTSHQLSMESQRLAVDARKAAAEIHKQEVDIILAMQKASLETRKSDESSAASYKAWVYDLQGNDSFKVQTAAVALGLGGRSNFPALAGALLYPAQGNAEQIKNGLRVASVIDAESVCNTLELAARQANRTSAGSLAHSLADLHCVGQLAVLKEMLVRHGAADIQDSICSLERDASAARLSAGCSVTASGISSR